MNAAALYNSTTCIECGNLSTSLTHEIAIHKNATCLVGGPMVDQLHEQSMTVLLPSFVFTSILISVGMPGNLLVILVYYFKMAKTTSRRFFISLAVCDFINCAFGMPVELALLSNFYNFDHPILCKVSRFMNYTLNNCSSCLLTFIAIDRYQRICHPLKPNMTKFYFKVMCTTAAVFSFLSASPALYIYGTKVEEIPVNGMNDTVICAKRCYVNDDADKTVRLAFSIYLLAAAIIMFVALMIIYVVIARKLFQRRHKMGQRTLKERNGTKIYNETNLNAFPKYIHNPPEHQLNPSGDFIIPTRDRTHSDISGIIINGLKIRIGRTTFILFIVTLVFVLSFVPHLVVVNLRYLATRTVESLNITEMQAFNVVLRSYLINSAINPLIYCFMNADFRKTVKRFLKQVCLQCLFCIDEK